MLKSVGRTGDGRPLVLLGLTGENMTRLMSDEPITFSLGELGLPDIQIALIGGRDVAALLAQLREAGVEAQVSGPD